MHEGVIRKIHEGVLTSASLLFVKTHPSSSLILLLWISYEGFNGYWMITCYVIIASAQNTLFNKVMVVFVS